MPFYTIADAKNLLLDPEFSLKATHVTVEDGDGADEIKVTFTPMDCDDQLITSGAKTYVAAFREEPTP
jgi:hypothetical protein